VRSAAGPLADVADDERVAVLAQLRRGATGEPEACTPDRSSELCTNSAVARFVTKRTDLQDVKVLLLKLRLNAFGSASGTDASSSTT
jgi:hypothetical protein